MGVMVAFLPTVLSASGIVVENGLAGHELHCTLRYYGADDVDLGALADAVAEARQRVMPFEVAVESVGTLGDDDARVLFLGDDDVWQVRDLLPPSENDFPTYRPHVTVGYDITESDVVPPVDGKVRFDRIVLGVDNEWTIWDLGSDEPPEAFDLEDPVTAAGKRNRRKKQKCYRGSPATCKSVKWLAVYRALRDKGYTKEKSARIANSMHNHWKSGIPRRGDKRPLIRKTV